MEKEPKYMRPENLLEAVGVDFKGLSEEEREMKTLLLEEYKKRGKNLIEEIKKWRGDNPKATLNEAIRALYKKEEV